jgi:hypothetical protein
MVKTKKSKKEYTISLDVAVFAENKEKAIQLIGQQLADGNFQYWLGNIVEEK